MLGTALNLDADVLRGLSREQCVDLLRLGSTHPGVTASAQLWLAAALMAETASPELCSALSALERRGSRRTREAIEIVRKLAASGDEDPEVIRRTLSAADELAAVARYSTVRGDLLDSKTAARFGVTSRVRDGLELGLAELQLWPGRELEFFSGGSVLDGWPLERVAHWLVQERGTQNHSGALSQRLAKLQIPSEPFLRTYLRLLDTPHQPFSDGELAWHSAVTEALNVSAEDAESAQDAIIGRLESFVCGFCPEQAALTEAVVILYPLAKAFLRAEGSRKFAGHHKQAVADLLGEPLFSGLFIAATEYDARCLGRLAVLSGFHLTDSLERWIAGLRHACEVAQRVPADTKMRDLYVHFLAEPVTAYEQAFAPHPV